MSNGSIVVVTVLRSKIESYMYSVHIKSLKKKVKKNYFFFEWLLHECCI